MNKVLVDRELLEKHISEIDSWNASLEKIIGKQPDYRWASLETLREAIAQPAEAEGTDVPVVAYQSRETGEFYEQSYGLDRPLELVLRSDHLAALSAVTAERDRIKADRKACWEEFKALAQPAAECTNDDSWNCKYCRKTAECSALNDPRNFGAPQQRPEVHLNAADKLPPVDCPLLIEVMKGYLVLAWRTGIIENKSADMEYRLVTGDTIQGRFRWTYP